MSTRVFGRELKVGDVIEVWWQPGKDQIASLEPYRGPLTCFEPEGAQIAGFVLSNVGMTIENGGLYERVSL